MHFGCSACITSHQCHCALQHRIAGVKDLGQEPEALQGEGGLQQMVNFIAPCKTALPVSSRSSAV